jgi:hypothetical protein
MTQAISISKAKILNYIQCPRRLWLEQYNPELEDPEQAMDEALEQTTAAKKAAHRSLDGAGIKVDAQRGLRSALEQTRSALESDASVLLDAAFEFDAVVVQVDVLRRDGSRMSIVKVCADNDASVAAIDDCAIQAWTLHSLGHDDIVSNVAIPRASEESGVAFEDLFEIRDVTADVSRRVPGIAPIVDAARQVLQSLDEPMTSVGPQCQQGYPCPFLSHCADH